MELGSTISKRIKAAYRRAGYLTQRAVSAKDDQTRQRFLSEALALARLCCSRYANDAEFKYLRAYILLKFKAKTPEIWLEAETDLREAVGFNPKHHFARYFLSCLLFNLKRYQESLTELGQISLSYFEGHGKHWVAASVLEVTICCKCYVGTDVSVKDDILAYETFVTSCDDPILIPKPTALCDCIEGLFVDGKMTQERWSNLEPSVTKVVKALALPDIVATKWPRLSSALN